jgi:hypothetical protein
VGIAIGAQLQKGAAPPEARTRASIWEVAGIVAGRVMPRISPPDAGFAPWRFWQSLSLETFRDVQDILPSSQIPFEDAGRSTLLTLGFEALGGVAPFLGLWLGPLASLPLFLWIISEFAKASRPLAGGAFLLLFSSSAFAVSCLWWPHAATGFYLLSLLLLVGVAVYCTLQPKVTFRGSLIRALLAGAFFALSVACRASTLLLLPGFVLAFAIGARRGPGRGAFLRGCVTVVAFLLPSICVGTSHHHAAWMSLWEGLGDFDREKGHAFNDGVAILALHRAGLALDATVKSWTRYGGLVSRRGEEFFKASVLADIRTDPLWYARILLNRLWATVAQEKLWSWAPRDRFSFPPGSYYRELATADSFMFGPWLLWVPVLILLAPTLALFVLVIRHRQNSLGTLLVIGCCATSALGAPVLVSTASAAETEAFIVIYLLGTAFLIEELLLRPGGQDPASAPMGAARVPGG